MKRGRNGARVARGRVCSGGAHGAEACMTIDDLGELVVPVVQGRVVSAPCKGTVFQWVRIPPGHYRSGR